MIEVRVVAYAESLSSSSVACGFECSGGAAEFTHGFCIEVPDVVAAVANELSEREKSKGGRRGGAMVGGQTDGACCC